MQEIACAASTAAPNQRYCNKITGYTSNGLLIEFKFDSNYNITSAYPCGDALTFIPR